MKQRLYDRFAAVLSIGLLAGLAGFSYYLAELAEKADRKPVRAAPGHEPDYFVVGLALTRTNAAGAPTFRMSASRLKHYPDDDSTVYEQPVLVSLDPTRPVVTLRAERGRTTSGGERTDLYDQVVMVRAGDRAQPELRIETDQVTLLAQEDIARTDRPVKILYGASALTGTGMEFDNASRTLKVLSRVHGVWAAPSKP
jgi:lipopolysaccharide export system protein LptC